MQPYFLINMPSFSDLQITQTSRNVFPDRDPWPKAVRLFPKQLIECGAFLAITSNQSHGRAHSAIRVAGNLLEKGAKVRSASYECTSKSLSPRHFKLLLELININKTAKVGDVFEFSPGKMLALMNIKSSGSAYRDLERMLCDLAKMTFSNSDPLVMEEAEGLLATLHTTNFSLENGDVIEASNNNRIWSFSLSEFMCNLLAHDNLSSVHKNILNEIGRSPILTWTYLFYSTHGSDGGQITPYGIKKLAERSGLAQRCQLMKSVGKADDAINAAMREIKFRIRTALVKLRALNIFKSVVIERTVASELLPIIEYKTTIERFKYSFETLLSESSFNKRSTLIANTPHE